MDPKLLSVTHLGGLMQALSALGRVPQPESSGGLPSPGATTSLPVHTLPHCAPNSAGNSLPAGKPLNHWVNPEMQVGKTKKQNKIKEQTTSLCLGWSRV